MNNNSYNNICNNNNNNNNNEYNIKLYNLVWNNIVIKKIILNYLNQFNILFNIDVEFQSIESLMEYRYKDYLHKVILGPDIVNLDDLPSNISKVKIQRSNINLNKYILSKPNQLCSIEISGYIWVSDLASSFIKSITSTRTSPQPLLSKLNLNISDREKLEPNLIPQSITDLHIEDFKQDKLKKNYIPNNVIKLSINNVEYLSDESLPQSLRDVSFEQSNPSIINQLSSLNNLVKLDFSTARIIDQFDINSNIRFPNTIQELIIQCGSFNTQLPNGLKLFKLKMKYYKYKIKFPSSLEKLIVRVEPDLLNQDLFDCKEDVPSGLKKLEAPFTRIVDISGCPILPDTLTKLIIHEPFNQELKANQLPSNLTYLDVGNLYSHNIDKNVLPPTLKQLILGNRYLNLINSSTIPSTLESLQINNTTDNHPLINLPTSTHPNIIINSYNISFYYDPSNTDIRVLKLPFFYSSLSALQLQDKSKLEYLHLCDTFNHQIQLSDLPINNQIKTLVLGHRYSKVINLKHFQKLETIILQEYSSPKIITTTYDNNNNNNNNNNNKLYNNYNLKSIVVPYNNKTQFIKYLDINFYQFLKRK